MPMALLRRRQEFPERGNLDDPCEGRQSKLRTKQQLQQHGATCAIGKGEFTRKFQISH